MLAGVNIKHFGLVGPKVDGTYWPHRESNLHNPLALGIGWPFTYCNAFNQYTMYTYSIHDESIREGCGRFNHSLCKQFLVGNCWLNEYMCEGGGERAVNSII